MTALLSKEKHVPFALCTIIASVTAAMAVKYLSSKLKKENNRDNDDIHHIITTRRTINTFEPVLPPGWENAIRKAIEAAITAPNHKRTEPWRFYIPNSDTVKKICELNASIVAEGNGGAKAGEAKLKKWLKVPGWLIVTCTKETLQKNVEMSDPKGREREDYAAVCCAIQNLSLSLHANGFGTKWSTGKVNFDERFNNLVGIKNDEYVVGTIWFGKPAKIPTPRETKLSVKNVLKIAN